MNKKIGNNEKCTYENGITYKKCCKLNSTRDAQETPKISQSEWIDYTKKIHSYLFPTRPPSGVS